MTSMVLMTCLAATLATPSRTVEHPNPLNAVPGAFFALSVGNFPESVQWYSQKLGLSIVFEVHQGVDVAVLEGGGLMVELLHDRAARPLSVAAPGVSQPQMVHGFFKAGFMVRNFDKAVEQLRARGVSIAFGPFPERDEQRANVIIRDNSGNLIQIFGD